MRYPDFGRNIVMKSKKIICGAVAAALTLSVTFSGCGLLSTINEEDMKQTIATVNIGKSDKLGEDLAPYAAVIEDDTISKRDLISAYINTYSDFSSSGVSSNATIFNSLVTQLTNNSVLVQYATAYLLMTKDKDSENTVTLNEYKAKTTVTDKLIYLLGGEESDGVKQARYNLYSSVNSALDSYERTEIAKLNKDDENDEYVGSDTRTTPGGIDTTVDDYLPLDKDNNLDYGIYTGYEGHLIKDAGTYEPLEKSSRNTRRLAYSTFLSNINRNYLLTAEDKDVTNVLELSYVKTQFEAQLQQSVVNEFNDVYNKEQEEKISMIENGEYVFVKEKYENLVGEQSRTNSDASTFESSMSSLSDTQFILYSPDTTKDTEATDGVYGTFGYVYNILLPFSVPQNKQLSKLQSAHNNEQMSDAEYFKERNLLLKQIETTDQRSAWFNGSTDYSFNAKEYNEENKDSKLNYYDGGKAERNYLFFENNLTKTTEYKPLEKYTGLYSYNGKVAKNTDGSYNLIPNKLTIDDMLKEFIDDVNFVLGGDYTKIYAGDSWINKSENFAKFYDTEEFGDKDDKDKIDYSNLVYATGKVELPEQDKAKENMFLPTSLRYKAMSAVNELQYAYTTDTGVLSQYIGYTVSAYETSYIKEFEYAAQQATKMGVGAIKVCAGDYGWHVIYVTDTFSAAGGNVFNAGTTHSISFVKDRIEKEGTFENKFYNWVKDSTLKNETTQKQTEILQYFANDKTIIKNEKAYKDLVELG